MRSGLKVVENGTGGGSDKHLRYPPDGRELDLYHPLRKCGVKLSDCTPEREKAKIKRSHSHPAGSTLLCSLWMPAAAGDTLRPPPALTILRGFPWPAAPQRT